ncbi:MAG: spermidine resistance protein [Trizodia sp. TS-e1964]|nr:MAG: spermidine resistance protein [Trizodia sp. TS-e1964]
MVNIEIPHPYTTSPSAPYGTPHLTINHQAGLDLDSSNAFEGPEKLLEVWFSPSADELPTAAALNGLKCVPAEVWQEMLDIVNCKVLSTVRSDHVDAYLLSESSMFVFPHKLILKTCGTTTLLSGLPRILEIAALSARFPHVAANLLKSVPAAATPYRVFYSRKNFLFPDKQRGPHRSWPDEVRYLDKIFRGGSAYMVGKMNGEHWYLYLTEPNTSLTPPLTPDHKRGSTIDTETKILSIPSGPGTEGTEMIQTHDETLEILMTDLDQQNAKQFYLEHASAVAENQEMNNNKTAANELGSILAEENCLGVEDCFDIISNTLADGNEQTKNIGNKLLGELSTEGHALGTVVAKSCGLSNLYPTSRYPGARIDAYLFSPCGFSANGVIPAPERINGSGTTHYFTVHVTPEPHCSYASFETNVPGRHTGRDTALIVEDVVGIFHPGRFSVTLFEAKFESFVLGTQRTPLQASSPMRLSAAKRSTRMDCIRGYRRVDKIVHDFDGYDLVFRYYERNDWKGGEPRLGENNF